MISVSEFLSESEGQKLKHIEHAEDLPINVGEEGFHSAHAALVKAHEHIKAGKHNSNLSMKYDGSPSIVYGHHPESGKFFVASKSAFNKSPKLNYTHEDVDKNHGHAPGLASKLKASLIHLKKIALKHGVYQGDLMYTHEDVHHHGGKASFTPNTITYTAHGEQAKKIKKSKIGLVTHTQYHGHNIESMSSSPRPDLSGFKHHEDVVHLGADHDTSKVKLSAKDDQKFRRHLDHARSIHHDHPEMYAATSRHHGESGHLKAYINSTVRTGEKPTAKGFAKHIVGAYQKEAAKLKSDSGKAKKTAEMNDHLNHITKHENHYNHLFEMHHHLQQAKNVLVHGLNQHEGGFEHHISGNRSAPEGFVVHHNEQPVKLVNRAEFARANLLKTRTK